MIYILFTFYLVSILQYRVFAQSNGNGVTCSCVSVGNCPSMNTGIDIRIVNTGSRCPAGQVNCCSSSDTTDDGSCGIRKISTAPHPQGQTSYGAYPWQAVLFTTNDVFVGSGVLITPNHVLTVAHKVASYVDGGLKVRLGEWDIESTSEPDPYQEYTIQSVVIHPNFNSVNLQNNVAVITLSDTVPISSSPNINTACFPKSEPASGSRCWVSGWGKDAFGANGRYQSIMKEVDVSIVKQSNCEASLRRTRLGKSYNLDKKSFICAGGETGKDACTGDGGSPLVCQSGNGQWEVVGMVAWGIGCATNNVPGVYVNVYNYVEWITQQIV